MYFTFSRPVYRKAVLAVGVFGQNCSCSHWADGIGISGPTVLLTLDRRLFTGSAIARCAMRSCCLSSKASSMVVSIYHSQASQNGSYLLVWPLLWCLKSTNTSASLRSSACCTRSSPPFNSHLKQQRHLLSAGGRFLANMLVGYLPHTQRDG